MHQELINFIAWITKASKSLIAALLPVLESDLSALLTELLPIAEQVVVGLATSSISGKEKQAAAFSTITSTAEAAGIQATAQAVNIAIELAVANLPKTSTAVSGTQVPPASTSAESSPVVPEQAAS
jgi:hypothetical protein